MTARAQAALLALFALGAALPSTLFLSLGAWPVAGFLGLDVAGLIIAFRAYRFLAGAEERIELTRDSLRVRCIPALGRAREYSFNPYWTAVRLQADGEESNRLAIGSHGRWLTIAAMLSPRERVEIAAALRAALAEMKT